ncbi:MAG: DUF4388 domain-containing protein [Cyanobacteria bacterium SZAS LIN-5]|nr:DUF4388 domain-containing protein [Cyanobacteria bacterium SZAS LIN-5]RTL41781.1 MAG: DUF4388 domain-containing protein [Candidatus Melainabacteria bacterium]
MQLTGELSKVSLPNLIQLVRNGELTGKIAFLNGARTATLYFDRGSIIHAEADGIFGKDALMELFLWASGSFSFMEDPLLNVDRTLNPFLPEESTDRLLREGMAYLEQKKYLDQLRISGQTILKVTDQARRAPKPLLAIALPILERVDGQRTLAQALADFRMTRREYVQAVYACLAEGLAVVVEAAVQPNQEQITLPPWVIARLKQDNVNISQAIVDMVIWVDRVKCWMYQVDSDFGRIIAELAKSEGSIDSAEDFFKELGQDSADYQGPFFGESMPGGVAVDSPAADIGAQISQQSKPSVEF